MHLILQTTTSLRYLWIYMIITSLETLTNSTFKISEKILREAGLTVLDFLTLTRASLGVYV